MRQAMAQRAAPSAGARAPHPLAVRTTRVCCPAGAFCRPALTRGPGLSAITTKCGAAATERDAPAASCATRKAAVADDIWPPGSVGAVILGGAEADSRRLYPLTRKRTLSSIPFAGLYRLIDIPMSNCFNCGINKIYVLTAFNSASLNRYICNTYNLGTGVLAGNGFVEVVANSQTPASKAWSEGAADAVRQFMQYCFNTSASKNRSIQDILVLPADHLYSTGFTRLVNVHRQSNADLTILCHQCDDEQAEQLGVMTLDASHRVIAFKEKPSGMEKTLMSMDIDDLDELLSDSTTLTMSDASDSESNGGNGNGNGTNGSAAARADRVAKAASGRRGYIGSTGIMLFRREVLDQVLRDNPHIRDFGRELIPALLDGNYLVMAHGMTDFWADIGNSVRDYYEGNMAMLSENPPVDLHQRDLPFYHSLQMLPPSQVDNCRVHQSILSIGCSVRDSDIKHSIVGIRTKIAPGCTIHDSIIMGADYYETEHNWGRECGPDFPPIGVGSNTVLKKVIVDKNSRIGSNVSLTNPDGIWESIDKLPYGICIRGGILVVPKSATIPDGTVL